ncbi:hypothetical protein EG829_00185 [bacterium]|nr:hypothetical protein [bacterium]
MLVFITFLFSCAAYASGEEAKQIPDRVTAEHWSCRDLAELTAKYEATERLPDSATIDGKTYTRQELARVLGSLLEKVVEKTEKEGPEAVSRDDLDRISRLHEALREELVSLEPYRTRREAIEKVLAPPEEPPFGLKAGVKGFLRGEGADSFRLPDFAYNPGHAEGRLLYRVLPYLYWHPTEFLDIHLEGQGYGYTGGSQYLGKISLYQGYVEGKIPGSDLVALKVGRQELEYGSAFILGANTWFQGLTFDAARLRLKPMENLNVDLLGGWYATPWSDGLKGNLVGGNASYTFDEDTVIEVYAFNDTGSYEHHSGEYLNIWGLRGTAEFGEVSFEIEPVFQSGRTLNGLTGMNDRINAWGGHADLTVEAEFLGRENTFFASYAYGSGGRDAEAGVSSRGEFRNPVNDSSLSGDMSLIGDLSGVDAGEHHASGLQIFNLGWGVDLTDTLNFSVTGRYFYANAVPAGFSRRIGLETDFSLSYAVSDTFHVLVGYDRFFTGKFFRDATGSGRDIDYGYVQAQFDLAWAKPMAAAKR